MERPIIGAEAFVSESIESTKTLGLASALAGCHACIANSPNSRGKPQENLSRFYHVNPLTEGLLTLRQPIGASHLTENKMAEACVSRTHRRHQGCRPPVLKTGRVTGPHALPRPGNTGIGNGEGRTERFARGAFTLAGTPRGDTVSKS